MRIPVASNIAGNVTIDVNVTDERNMPVTSGNIEVQVEDQPAQVIEVTGGVIPVKLDVETNGTVHVTVNYLGNDKYNPSVGMNGTM